MLKIEKKEVVTYIMVIFTLMALASRSFAQNGSKIETKSETLEIDFTDGNWNEIATKARTSNKYIFVDAYTTWCSPCKLLKADTFKEKETARYFNANFINATFDMESSEGIPLAEKWKVTAYPTLLFFTPQGKLVLKKIGFVDGKQLIEFADKALNKT